jgi:hypothetical protein
MRTPAVRLVLDEGKTIAAAARDLDLTPSSLRYWVEQARASDERPDRPDHCRAGGDRDSAKRSASCARSATCQKKPRPSSRPPVKFAWIQAEKASYPLAKLCRWLGVTRSGFYAWRQRPESTHACEDRRLKVLVHASFAATKQRYGSPRIHLHRIKDASRIVPGALVGGIRRLLTKGGQ